MASETDICNIALSHIRAPAISSLSENTLPAIECNRHYELSRDAVLSDFSWNFATKRIGLALSTGDEIEKWTYAYAYPSDCLRALAIWDGTGANTSTYYESDTDEWQPSGRVQFEVGVDETKNKRLIFTNQEDAVLIYTARVTAPPLYSSQFITMLSYQLATQLAMPLKGDVMLMDVMQKTYALLLGQARATNAREGHEIPSESSSLLTSRG